jgi:hypothetical protein
MTFFVGKLAGQLFFGVETRGPLASKNNPRSTGCYLPTHNLGSIES